MEASPPERNAMEEEDKARLLEGMRGIIPTEIIELLETNELVLWCSTCFRSIYEATARNSVTERVAKGAIAEHEASYTVVVHRVTPWGKGAKESKPN